MTRKRFKRIKRNFYYLGIRLLVELSRRTPRRLGLRLFRFLGWLSSYFPHREQRKTTDHLRLIFSPAKPSWQIRRLARQCWMDLAANFYDAVHASAWTLADMDRYVEHDDLTPFAEAYKLGKGVIVVTGHIGCFELLLHYFARKGFECFAIGIRLHDPRMDALVAGARSGERIRYVNRDDVRGMLRLLRQGRAMGVLIDQDTRVGGVFAHFLGKTAYTPSGPVRLAMGLNIPLFVVTIHRTTDNKHRVVIGQRFPLVTGGDFTSDLVLNVEAINARLSDAIMAHPSQWVWMHRRWRRNPKDPRYLATPNIEQCLLV